MSFNASTSSLLPPFFICFISRPGFLLFASFVFSYVLFLPLFFFIIYLAVQQRRKQRCRSTAARTSHSDFFAYNVVGLELLCVLGYCLVCVGLYSEDQILQLVGMFLSSIPTPGHILFHLLTCVERYLAVVHPISYLSLKQAAGLRVRNASAACVWLLSAVILIMFNSPSAPVYSFCILVFSLSLVSFCSFSVLCVLHQSGPGQVSRDRKQVDQTKQRAFNTIAAIMLAQWCKFVGILVCSVVFNSSALTLTVCVVGTSALWLNLPCSLVLPLLYLQRAGKRPGCTPTP